MVQIFNDDLGDWVTLYVDGVKRMEGHSLDLHRVFKVLGIALETRSQDDLILADDNTKRDEVENILSNTPDSVEQLNQHLKEDKRFTV